ncbi:25S rRNA (adenine(2142)-N(1))-methyltransferase [Trichomonascus vanleenenianus]|uniref:25S rRNA (adenine2142-N1)-methyltransferase n=1 Tax=Trichomonascus vanleenenianus TaxID=2268995 RepID=UPI003ECB9666
MIQKKAKLGKRPTSITGKKQGPDQFKIGSKHGKRIIRRHHTLLKQKATIEALESQNKTTPEQKKELEAINVELHRNGGLEKYQLASIAGQDPRRGGDSSKVLISWLKEDGTSKGLSMLEVGCLSVENACSKSGFFNKIERIDLNSQHVEIKQQDFMQRPVTDDDKYDMISLSLVVNYVPEVRQRGEMLRRTLQFLNPPQGEGHIPAVFLVLPTPCVSNSRYFTEKRLDDIMQSLGFRQLHQKTTPRITYWYYQLCNCPSKKAFRKELLHDGKARNNFSIILE